MKSILWIMMLGLVVLCMTGCDHSKELENCRQQNKLLTQRIAELESRLADAEESAVPTLEGQTLYLVVEGDSLWKIAQKQLGDGTRYNEILALNPHLNKEGTNLAIGMILKLPPK